MSNTLPNNSLIYRGVRRVFTTYAGWNRKKRTLFWLLILLVGASLPTFLPEPFHYGTPPTAELYFLPIPTHLIPNQQFNVELHVRTSTPVNALGTVMHFNPNFLSVEKMTTDQSLCSFYAENSFDTIKGEVHLFCGVPNPGFTGDSLVFRLTMRSRSSGVSTITLDPSSQVLANDGKGTNTIGPLPTLTVNVPATF